MADQNDYTAAVWAEPTRDEQVPALQRAFHAELCGTQPHSGRDDGEEACEAAYAVFSRWNFEAALLRADMARGRRT